MRQEHPEFFKGGNIKPARKFRLALESTRLLSGWRSWGFCCACAVGQMQTQVSSARVYIICCSATEMWLNCSGFWPGAAVTIVSRNRPFAVIHFCSCCLGGCGHSIFLSFFFFLPFSSFFRLLLLNYINIKPKLFHLILIFFRNAVLQITTFLPPRGTFHMWFFSILFSEGRAVTSTT